jgi:mono/diheme cytochrome c family protein
VNRVLTGQAAARREAAYFFQDSGRRGYLALIKGYLAVIALTLLFPAYGWADGAADFKMKCAPCHGSRGAGDTKLGENLHVRDLGSVDVQKQSDGKLIGIITKGNGTMPGYGDKLSRDQINEIVKFIRTLKR